MKNRFQKYVESKRTTPIEKREQVKTSTDKHINQDFPGYPDSPSKENVINPKTKQEKKVAAVTVQDGEKVNKSKDKGEDDEVDEQQSDGSGGAFSATEFLIDDEE
jgi:hypothetical protein